MPSMHEVEAILLTVGEPSCLEAERSLREQTQPLLRIHRVEGVRPFGTAFNQGVSAVQAPFFLQCDADMVLEPNCVERLLEAMSPEAGMAMAYLEDPLQGPVIGVKLFRSQVCRDFPVGTEPDCETRQVRCWKDAGWKLKLLPEVLGHHRQDLMDESYLFERFRLLGHKGVVRDQWNDITERFLALWERRHQPTASLCARALLLGMFLETAVEPQSLTEPTDAYKAAINKEWAAYPELPADLEECYLLGQASAAPCDPLASAKVTSSQLLFLAGQASGGAALTQLAPWISDLTAKLEWLRDYVARKLTDGPVRS